MRVSMEKLSIGLGRNKKDKHFYVGITDAIPAETGD